MRELRHRYVYPVAENMDTYLVLNHATNDVYATCCSTSLLVVTLQITSPRIYSLDRVYNVAMVTPATNKLLWNSQNLVQ